MKTYPTTMMATAHVRPGKSEAFVAWQARHTAVISKFPGFISSDIIPADDGDSREWTVIVNFEEKEEFLSWESSAERNAVMGEVSALLEGGGFTDTHIIEGERQQQGTTATEVIFSKVRKGQGDGYREWAARIQAAQARFPGYRGAYLQPPARDEEGHWMTIIRYDTPAHLNAWMSSPERAELIKESEAFIESEELLRFSSAFPGWVPLDPTTGEAPANWKTAMLVLLGLFPIVVLELKYLTPVLNAFHLNVSLATFIGNVISVALTSFVTMPLFVRWFRWWLLPQKNRARASWLGSALICLIYAIEVFVLWWLFV